MTERQTHLKKLLKEIYLDRGYKTPYREVFLNLTNYLCTHYSRYVFEWPGGPVKIIVCDKGVWKIGFLSTYGSPIGIEANQTLNDWWTDLAKI
jgi:hypothetical protein